MSTELIWSDRVDDKYDVRVEREAERTGRFKILLNDEVLFESTVNLAYGAMFGPDIGDVREWQEMAIAYIDDVLENTLDLQGSEEE